MTSKEFKQTAKTVCTNFQKHARAMDNDIKMLIKSLLDVIDTKIVALKKLLKLRAYIHNIATSNYLAKLDEANVQENNNDSSLEDLSSMVYEADQNSLPRDNLERKRKFMKDISDLKSTLDPKETLEKYIYNLSDIKSEQLVQKKGSSVRLGKADYESVLDILNKVLESYESQEESFFKSGKVFQEIDSRKIASENVCLSAKRPKNSKKQSVSF